MQAARVDKIIQEDAGRSLPLAVRHYTSAPVAPDDRHRAWAGRAYPSVAGLFESVPIGPFSTTAERVELDGLEVQFADGTARELDRTVSKLRADGIALLGIGIQLDGEMTGSTPAGPFTAGAGALLLLDLAQPAKVLLPTGRSMQLSVPRAVAERVLGPVAQLHGTVVPAERGILLVGHLLRLHDALPTLASAQRMRLARTILDLLALALDRADTGELSPDATPGDTAAAAARRAIEARLGMPTLGVSNLCQQLGMSRSALYRAFEAEGGVEAYIRRRRLDMVRAALTDPHNRERIGDLAYRWGFSDASHLSRQFREAFGTTPRAFRAAHGGGGT